MEHRYQPMVERKLAEEADVAAMHAKLAKRSGSVAQSAERRGSVETQSESCPRSVDSLPRQPEDAGSSPAGTALPTPPIKLEWEMPAEGATGVKTKCGRYSVSKIVVNGKTSYELWKFVPSAIWFHQLANKLPSFKEASRLANKDLNK